MIQMKCIKWIEWAFEPILILLFTEDLFCVKRNVINGLLNIFAQNQTLFVSSTSEIETTVWYFLNTTRDNYYTISNTIIKTITHQISICNGKAETRIKRVIDQCHKLALRVFYKTIIIKVQSQLRIQPKCAKINLGLKDRNKSHKWLSCNYHIQYTI